MASVTGEGIALALNRVDSFDPERGDLTHWCFLHAWKIADRDLDCMTRDLRADRVAEEQAPYESQQEDPFDRFFCSQELAGLFRHLTREQTLALAYVHYLGYSVRETAVILRRKENAVHALIHRGREKARQVYREMMTVKSNRKMEPNSVPTSHPRPRSSLSSEEDDDGESSFRAC